ncbi:NADH dehydrogenase [ubiquinone] 1 beta subcomplex subunit 2, mitochondrial [Rhineura floridana]|uniref:NADH dehydrogenase [ubiquinone] 1 beta subcomplex subunit 2, mitochondrial n=1 Tax=Rhineura floridana TaxID=261503 RepID=UPI002AC855A0|nr:NADH dehydrogenase [ubiquinone] 1 beta subcomplex subunit 2, mitochondrial [Rhineura floridana]
MMGSLGRMSAGLRFAARVLRARSGQGTTSGVRRASGDVHIQPQYRAFPQPSRANVIKGEILSGFMWFWILWHFWHEPEAVLGHFPYPDPFKWTDEELGIPPDYED